MVIVSEVFTYLTMFGMFAENFRYRDKLYIKNINIEQNIDRFPQARLCYIKPNTHRWRRRDSTVELRRVGGVYWALCNTDRNSELKYRAYHNTIITYRQHNNYTLMVTFVLKRPLERAALNSQETNRPTEQTATFHAKNNANTPTAKKKHQNDLAIFCLFLKSLNNSYITITIITSLLSLFVLSDKTKTSIMAYTLHLILKMNLLKWKKQLLWCNNVLLLMFWLRYCTVIYFTFIHNTIQSVKTVFYTSVLQAQYNKQF